MKGGIVVGLTGATGHIGGCLARRLLADPGVREVRSVARRPMAAPRSPDSVPGSRWAHVQADLCSPRARAALAGSDIIYHLAAQVWEGQGDEARRAMYRTNVDGAANVRAASPGAFVLASSVAVYGAWPDNDLPMDESHRARPNPECPYAAQKLTAERICGEGGQPWAVIRLAAVLGPHADARVARAVRGYRWAVPAVSGAHQAVQWLDEDDAVEALLAAGRELATGRISAEIINVAPNDWLEAKDVARLARGRVLNLPRTVLLAGARTGKGLRLTPFGADRAVLLGGPLAVSSAKAQDVLGWHALRSSGEVLAGGLDRAWRSLPTNRGA